MTEPKSVKEKRASRWICGLTALMLSAPTTVAAGDTWPFTVTAVSDGVESVVEYEDIGKAEKPWNICVLLPHLKDSYWLGVNYGIADQARRMGVKATILSAGGYTELNKQVAQYNDCVAAGVDAIILGVISEAGLEKSMLEGKEKGIAQVTLVNPVHNDIPDTKIFVTYDNAAEAATRHMIADIGDEAQRMLILPGPQGSGWAENVDKGTRLAVEGTNINVLETVFGDTGKSIQLKLLEDAVQAHGDVDMILGTAVTAEVALQVFEDAGLDDVKIATFYINEGIVDMVRKGEVASSVTESPVMMSRMAVDSAVRHLEGEKSYSYIRPNMTVLSQDNINDVDLTRAFAPDDWQPVYAVE